LVFNSGNLALRISLPTSSAVLPSFYWGINGEEEEEEGMREELELGKKTRTSSIVSSAP
jgi:hypothetical protein